MKPAHKRASRVLGYALTLGCPVGWQAASALWQARLTPQEIAALASAALKATAPDLAQLVAEAFHRRAGAPLPTFGDVMLDARFWADLASSKERAAYAVACTDCFTEDERKRFVAFLVNRQ